MTLAKLSTFFSQPIPNDWHYTLLGVAPLCQPNISRQITLIICATCTLNWGNSFRRKPHRCCGTFYAAGERCLVGCFRVNMLFWRFFPAYFNVHQVYSKNCPPGVLRGSSEVRNAPPAHVGLRPTRAGGLERALIDTHAVIPISRQA